MTIQAQIISSASVASSSSVTIANSGVWKKSVSLSGIKDVREAMEVAKLNFKVGVHPTFVMKDGVYEEIEACAVLREDTKDVLGVRVSPKYQPIQNEQVFDLLQPALDRGDIQLLAAGVIDKGKKIYVLAKGRMEARIKGEDRILEHQLFTFGHDGGSAMHIIPDTMRIACTNMISSMIMKSRKEGRLISVRHTGDIEAKLQGVSVGLGYSRKAFEEFANFAEFLASTRMDARQFHKFVKYLLPRKSDELELSTRTANKRDAIVSRFEQADGDNTVEQVRHTAWQAFNSVTHEINHAAGGMTQEKRDRALVSLYEGVNLALAERAALGLANFAKTGFIPEEFDVLV